MSETVEPTSLDLRYQTYRLRNDTAEARLLASIAERGIERPLAGVDTPRGRLLLDGFKRYRCATKLGLECLPYVCLGEEEAMGIASLMRVAEQKTLSILEQARFVAELLSIHEMSIADVAETLSRSKAWVSMRRGLLKEISPAVQEILFRGGFPVYSYMATLRPFMRMNGVGRDEIERFVQALAGQRLSVREIELLAHGYFRGPASLREAIGQGNWKWSLEQMQAVPEDPELLERLYHECGGWLQRIHEKLLEEEGIQVAYSTLTRILRDVGLSRKQAVRCDRVPDQPGAEMQHDTTIYQVKLAEKRTKVVASLLYLRYCKRRYLKFYRVFNRFAMKCFLHEALMYWGYSARQCIIDNTNLARLRGAGSRAVIVPEMNAFSRRCGFQFARHAIGHANRKAGNERSFWTVQTNFLPGRTFESLEDLNRQGRQWATLRMELRPQTKTRLIPAKLFEHERGYLNPLPRQADVDQDFRAKCENGRLLRRKRANIPEMLEMETFPFSRKPKLDRKKIISYYDSFDYMTKQRGMVWMGPTGCGKTGLATAFLLQAIDRGHRGYFVTFPELLQELFQSLADRSEGKVLRRYLSYDCLVIDEVGYVEVEAAQVGQFFTLMHKRHKKKTTLITSNLGFSEWGSFLHNNHLTAALIDRLTENSYVINIKDCQSLRDKLDE